MIRLFLILTVLAVFSGCAWSARLGAVGTVRDLSDLGAEATLDAAAGRSCGRGTCLTGVTAATGFFGRDPVYATAGKLEYLWFFGSNAASVQLSAGPRQVGDTTGMVVQARITAFEAFPSHSPKGSIGAGLQAAWGFGDEAVRGGWFGVGLFWEFGDIFSWK